jgi:hypothetical protein
MAAGSRERRPQAPGVRERVVVEAVGVLFRGNCLGLTRDNPGDHQVSPSLSAEKWQFPVFIKQGIGVVGLTKSPAEVGFPRESYRYRRTLLLPARPHAHR